MKNAETSKKDQLKAKVDAVSRRFKLGSHYGIERFGVVTGAALLTGGLIFAGGVHSGAVANRADLAATALFTEDFTSSKTLSEGTVTGVYTNPGDTRAMVMMKFDDPATMSSNPDDYYIYATGIKDNPGGGPTKVKQAMAGSVVTFGTSGWLGVMLEAPDGFKQQLINLTVRAKNEIATPSPTASTKDVSKDDPSFTKYDQWRVIVNPAGSEATESEALDGESINPRYVYAELANRPEEAELRSDLNETLAEMKTQLERIRNYESEMARTTLRVGPDENVTMVPPVLPATISGDSIEGLSSTELTEALNTNPLDQVPMVKDQSDTARNFDIYGDEIVNTYMLSSQEDLTGGLNFNWRLKSLAQGYLEDITPAGVSPSRYLAELMSQSSENRSSGLGELEWPLSNGMLLKDLERTSRATVRDFSELRNNAQQAYSKYFQLKKTYEVDQLYKLALMDLSVTGYAANTDIATGDDAVEFSS